MKQENRGNAKLIVLGAAGSLRATVADVPAGEMLLSIALVVAATF